MKVFVLSVVVVVVFCLFLHNNEPYKQCSPAGDWCNTCDPDPNLPGAYKCRTDSGQYNSGRFLPQSPCMNGQDVKNCDGQLFCTSRCL